MGSEAGLRSTLKKKIGDKCHYVRVENTCETGTPDVNLAWKDGCSCWIELKYLADFPKKPTTNVKLECYTHDQMVWLMTRWSVKQGGSWLFCQVGGEYFLFTGRNAGKLYYGVTTNEFKELAYWRSKKGWCGKNFLSHIKYLL